MPKTKCIATGDIFITRNIPQDGYEGFNDLKNLIESHDVRFTNLEMTFHNAEGYPAATSGGTWAMTNPEMLDDVKRFGFNLYNTANNHSGDYSHGGVLATIRHLKERNMIFSGTGQNLGEASKSCYLETKNARVALISCSASSDKSHIAGAQSGDLIGRPGLNPLRHSTVYHLDEEHFEMVKKIAKVSKINAKKERSIAMGYSSSFPQDILPLGEASFMLDTKCFTESIPNKQDMLRIESEIKEAKRQADIVLVSVHSHARDGYDVTKPAQFIETFSKMCIDAGATAVLGHGPHELQGIELYNGGVIFYSLGNFLFETETIEVQPADAFINRSMPLDTKIGEYMDKRSKNGTAGYIVLPEIWFSVVASFTIDDGKLSQIELHPISLSKDKPRSQRGVPILTGDESVIEYLQNLSNPFGTKIEIQNGKGIIMVNES